MESENVNFDEIVEEHDDDELGKESENYRSFVYFYDGMKNQEDVVNKTPNQQQISISVKSQIMNEESQLGPSHVQEPSY